VLEGKDEILVYYHFHFIQPTIYRQPVSKEESQIEYFLSLFSQQSAICYCTYTDKDADVRIEKNTRF